MGNCNGSHKYPERLAWGDANWTRRHPEKLARGQAWEKIHGHENRRGESNGNAKLTAKQAEELRKAYLALECNKPYARYPVGKIIGKRFGVSQATANEIARGRKWSSTS